MPVCDGSITHVWAMQETMHRRRVTRFTQLGFPAQVAEEMSEMHTPNFM